MNVETIYVDSLHHCNRDDDGAMTAIQTDFFTGRCDTFVEGYCFESDTGNGEKIYPWKPYNELAAAQAQYELDIAEAAAAYQEGVDSAYDQ